MENSPAELVLFVRFQSDLTPEQVLKISNERAPQFRALGGISQKYYLQDVNTGEYAGMYLWRTKEDLEAFMGSELRATIATAYQVKGASRVEVYKMYMALRA